MNQNHPGYLSSKDQTRPDHLLRPDQPDHWFWLWIIKNINAESSVFTLSYFGLWSKKLGGTIRAIKIMTNNDNGPGPGRNYRETAIFTFGRKAVSGQNCRFFLENTRNLLKGYFFVSTTYFLGPKIRFLLYNTKFCQLFLALGEMVHFAPWDWFFDFLFPSYGRFREKKNTKKPGRLPLTALARRPGYSSTWFLTE